MKSALASVAKNLILLAVLVFSALNYFYPVYSWKVVVGAQLFTGVVYVFLSCYEYLNASYKASLPVQRYPYFSHGYFMFRALKTGIFLSFALLLQLSDNPVRYLAPICYVIAGTEAVTTYLKFRNKLCFVNIYANYILLMQQQAERVFVSDILFMEFRHGIFYFVKHNRRSMQIHLDFIEDQEKFLQALHVWITRNQVMLSEESRDKIRELIEQ